MRKKAARVARVSKTETAVPPSIGDSAEQLQPAEDKKNVVEASSSTSISTSSQENSNKKDLRPKKNPFEPRRSKLDIETLETEASEQRGWANFLLVGVLFYFILSTIRNLQTKGVFVSTDLWRVITQDIEYLLLADLVLILWTFTAFFLVKSVVTFKLPRPVSRVIQHTIQAALILGAPLLAYYRKWPWSQRGFLVCHAISMVMKMHSYIATNEELADEMHKTNKKSDHSKKEASKEDEGNAVQKLQYPNNVTLVNFIYYLAAPTLVYELDYPRTESIRPLYIVEKVLNTMATFTLLYSVVEHQIMPILFRMREYSLVETIMELIFPFMVCYMGIFHIIFNCILNLFAEFTYFGDRAFYDDWWNSCTFDEYARKWNKPVHEFLLRHVYIATWDKIQNRSQASVITFLISSVVHEYVLFIVGARVRFYLFWFQMLQLPLIWLWAHPALRKMKRVGNMLFWVAMWLGPPLICVLYARDHYLNP